MDTSAVLGGRHLGGDDRDSDLAVDDFHPGQALGTPIAGGGGDDRGPSLRLGDTSLAGHHTIVANADQIAGWVKSMSDFEFPPPPAWLAGLPLFGGDLVAAWEKIALAGLQDFMKKLAPYGGTAIRWFAAEVGGFGALVLQFLLTVVFAALLYAKGEHTTSWIERFGRRLAGPRGEHSIRLAGQAVRGVALGVVVTALAQSVLGGVGLAVAGVPFAAVLTAVMFMLAIAQIGPLPVLGPSVAWLYWSGSTGWGTFLLLWTLVVGTMDNFLRPFLIKKGADLPLLLIFVGVVGGLVAFGLIGIFVGPVVLAVGHTLLSAWVDEEAGEVEPTGQQES